MCNLLGNVIYFKNQSDILNKLTCVQLRTSKTFLKRKYLISENENYENRGVALMLPKKRRGRGCVRVLVTCLLGIRHFAKQDRETELPFRLVEKRIHFVDYNRFCLPLICLFDP